MSASEERRAAFRTQALPARVVSGILLGGIALAGAWRGGLLFDVLLGIVLLLGLLEFLRMAGRAGYPVSRAASVLAGAAWFVYAVAPSTPGLEFAIPALALLLIAGTLRAPIAGRVPGLAFTLFGTAYVVGLGLELHALRVRPEGNVLVAAVLAGTWMADTAAFFVGVRWGRRRLAPAISPGKSVEGLLGGTVGAVAATAAVLILLGPDREWGRAVGLGLAVALGAPLGDLFESLLKRNFEVKDSSRLIPGHGGVLDRIDSLLFAGAAASALLRILEP